MAVCQVKWFGWNICSQSQRNTETESEDCPVESLAMLSNVKHSYQGSLHFH